MNKRKRYKLVYDEDCQDCVINLANNLKNDIYKINSSKKKNFIDIKEISTIDDYSSLNIKKLYILLSSPLIQYEYNILLNRIFNKNIHFQEILLMTNNDIYISIKRINDEIKTFFKNFGSNYELDYDYEIDNRIIPDIANYLIKKKKSYIDIDQENIKDFNNIIHMTDMLLRDLDSKYIGRDKICQDKIYDLFNLNNTNQNEDVISYIHDNIDKYIDDNIEYYCNKYGIDKIYYYKHISINYGLRNFTSSNPEFNKPLYSDKYSKFYHNRMRMNDNEKIDMVKYFYNILYNFFNELLEYIVNNDMLSNYNINNSYDIYLNKIKILLDNDEYSKIDINKTKNTINEIISMYPQLKQISNKLIDLFNKYKYDFLNNNNLLSLKLLFIINYYIYNINYKRPSHIINESEDLIDMLKTDNLKIPNNFDDTIERFFSGIVWDYFSTYYHMYNINNKKTNFYRYYDVKVRKNNIHNLNNIFDYFILLHFAMFNYDISNDIIIKPFINIMKKRLNINTINENIQEKKIIQNIDDIDTVSNNNNIYDIHLRRHQTLLIKLNNKFIHFDSNNMTYFYDNDLMKQKLGNYKSLSLNLVTINEGIQQSEIYNVPCFRNIDRTNITDFGEGFCASWAFYFKLVYLMNYDKINNYDDLVSLLRTITLDKIYYDNSTKERNRHKLITSLFLQLYLLIKTNIISSDIIQKIFPKNDIEMVNNILESIESDIKNKEEYLIFRNL